MLLAVVLLAFTHAHGAGVTRDWQNPGLLTAVVAHSCPWHQPRHGNIWYSPCNLSVVCFMGWGFLMPVGLLRKTFALIEVNCLMSTEVFSLQKVH